MTFLPLHKKDLLLPVLHRPTKLNFFSVFFKELHGNYHRGNLF
jgi:hypothetical protein